MLGPKVFRWLASLLFSVCLINSNSFGVAWAQASADTPASKPLSFAAPLEVAVGLDAKLTVQEVAALPRERFTAFAAKAMQPMSIDQPLWLRMQLDPNEVRRSNALLELPSVLVDRYEVYQRDASGAWQMAVAGDRVAHRQWPLNSLRPRFPLNPTGATPLSQEVYVRVVHQLPGMIEPTLVNANQATQRDVGQMLIAGVLAGLMTALLLICLQMTLSYRDRTDLWYAGYLLATLMAAMAYCGVGQQFLWPTTNKFSSDAIVYFVLAAFSFNLLFVSAMFGKWLGRRYVLVTRILIAMCIAYMVHTIFVEDYASSIMVFLFICVAITAFILFTAVQAWRKGVPYSGYWLLVYIPYLLSIILITAVSAGQITLAWLPVNTPMFSAMLEAVAMMFCLNAYSRESHAQAVREQIAEQRDPLTGFLNEARFMDMADKAWLRAGRTGGDVSLAYVLVECKQQNLSIVEAEALMLRSVRMVRTAMRESDSIGRIGRNILGISMPDAKPGDALNASLQRLVALGLMLDPRDKAAQALTFTVAVGSWRITPEDFKWMDKRLRSLLAKDTEERQRAIRYLEPDL